ncbi:hypothetical protein [Vibrio rotiferianus]|uniref:hypothetical protein n=1 Tax=Vibrio rotiferianus TaxID=190895 RepID=UPI002894D452|nr:conserved exported hypothetical protein [Vibrio rotiferianus]CAH1558581.1 conserved exported hypothetical protein [Vibrio rotiferianus]
MPWYFIRHLFLLLCAMAFVPAYAAISNTEVSVPSHVKIKVKPVVSNQVNQPVDFKELTEEEPVQSPVSEGHVSQDSYAIFNYQRFTSHLRENIDDEHVDSVPDLTSPFYADAGYAYGLHTTVWRQNRSTFNHFVSDHRLSGWKETNAMYVALNSQFSA